MHRFAALVVLMLPFAVAAADTLPVQKPIEPAVPVAQDVPYPGTITLAVDATDVTRGIFHVEETIPVAGPGPLTLLFPKWIPGKHRVDGLIRNLAGLRITADGETLPWVRDNLDVYAFHVDVPDSATAVTVTFQFLAPTKSDQGRIVTAPSMLNLQWFSVSLYPAGTYTRRIPVAASITLPDGWTPATALDLTAQDGTTFHYAVTDYDTLVDSPIFAGAHTRREQLAANIWLNVVADEAKDLAASEAALQAHRDLATQALKLFGGVHFDDYEFLLALSDYQGGIGVEHQRSSENGVAADYFTDWAGAVGDRDLLPHEIVHSWNGKYCRPAGMWTDTFSTPMRDDLLWVYEGQTQYWGYVLAARSGMLSQEETLGALAHTAAYFEAVPGRRWRPLADTTHDPIVAQRLAKGWGTWQRGEDYYSEGLLIWLEVDTLIRERSGGARSLEDFARAFFGLNDGDLGQLTYEFEDVVAALEAIEPYDWATFLSERVHDVRPAAPLEGLARGGYRLVWKDEPNVWAKGVVTAASNYDFYYSLGLRVNTSGEVTLVWWDSPAFDAGLSVGTKIVALNDRTFKTTDLKAALVSGQSPLRLLVQKDDVFRTVEITYDGGLRYPHLEKIGDGEARLDRILAPLD